MPAKKAKNSHKELTIGEIRIERKADKSVIQVLAENKWKSACAISHRNSRHHRRLISEIFELAVENDWDIEAMQPQRNLLLDDE